VWRRLLSTITWMEAHRTSGLYVPQIDAPGVDTKFIERHQRVLAQLLGVVLPPERVDLTAPVGRFARRYGFLDKPEYIRLRRLDPAGDEFSELTVRTDKLAGRPRDLLPRPAQPC
jgi:hypothetical protein